MSLREPEVCPCSKQSMCANEIASLRSALGRLQKPLLRNWHVAASVLCEAALPLPGRDCFGGSALPRNNCFLQKEVRGALWSYSQ
jgi:hypothetical protein